MKICVEGRLTQRGPGRQWVEGKGTGGGHICRGHTVPASSPLLGNPHKCPPPGHKRACTQGLETRPWERVIYHCHPPRTQHFLLPEELVSGTLLPRMPQATFVMTDLSSQTMYTKHLKSPSKSTCSLTPKAISNHERKANRIPQTNISNRTGNIPLAHAREVGTQVGP